MFPVCRLTEGVTVSLKVLLVIPAYNEALNIERVVDELRADYPQYDYVVINDGSQDDTAAVCRKRRYRFIDLPINLGLAGAFQTGIKYAALHDYDCAIQFDADGQHRPEYLGSLIDGLSDSDIVIGSRFIDERKPFSLRMIGNSLLSAMIGLTTGTHLSDPTSGMRAYGRRGIAELAAGPNLGPEPDTLAYLIKRRGLTVSEVKVRMAERTAGESYLNIRNSSAYMFRMVVSVMLIQLFR